MYYTIHARSFGHSYEDIGQELDTLEAAQAEAADLWPGCSVRVEGNREWVIVHNGEKVGEIQTAHALR